MKSFHLRSYTVSKIICDRWRKEWLFNLRESQKIQLQDDNRQVISSGRFMLIEEDNVPKFCWKVGLIEKVLQQGEQK